MGRRATLPRCYAGCDRPVQVPTSRFCTRRCAAEYAEELVRGNDDAWCLTCRDWVGVPHDHDTVEVQP